MTVRVTWGDDDADAVSAPAPAPPPAPGSADAGALTVRPDESADYAAALLPHPGADEPYRVRTRASLVRDEALAANYRTLATLPQAPLPPPPGWQMQRPDEGQGLDTEHRVDRDLADLGADQSNIVGRRVSAPRRRRPDELPIVYLGRRRGSISDTQITLVVPDEDNDALVAELSEMIEPAVLVDQQGVERPNKRVLPQRLHKTGPSYQFTINESTLVWREDAPFLLQHPDLVFVLAEEMQPQLPAPVGPGARYGAAAPSAQFMRHQQGARVNRGF